MQRPEWHVRVMTLCLLIMGLSTALYRHEVLTVPLWPTQQSPSWTVEANLTFSALPNTPVKVSFPVLHRPPGYLVLDEFFVGNGYGVVTNVDNTLREATWSKRRASGQQSLYYRVVVQRGASKLALNLTPPAVRPASDLTEVQHSAAVTLAQLARKTSADIQTFAQETVKLLRSNNEDSARVLMGETRSNGAIVNAAMLVLREAHIPVIPVNGLRLTQAKNAVLEPCLLIWVDNQPVFIDPQNGNTQLPNDFLVWTFGAPPLFQLSGGSHPVFHFSVSPATASALEAAKQHGLHMGSLLMRFSLLHLPLNLQQTYQTLLMVPLGAVMMLLLRQYVGLNTFGTFMPVLIAMAFRQTCLVWGIFFFSMMVAAGLGVRLYLSQLRLLNIPRLASVLTVVVMLMVFVSILSQQLGLQSGLSVALFPMVIMTMFIERMCVMWDERGASAALLAGVGSLFAAVMCFIAMNQPLLRYWLFAFPELLLVVLALIISLGQYRGYRLLELRRFSALLKD